MSIYRPNKRLFDLLKQSVHLNMVYWYVIFKENLTSIAKQQVNIFWTRNNEKFPFNPAATHMSRFTICFLHANHKLCLVKTFKKIFFPVFFFSVDFVLIAKTSCEFFQSVNHQVIFHFSVSVYLQDGVSTRHFGTKFSVSIKNIVIRTSTFDANIVQSDLNQKIPL